MRRLLTVGALVAILDASALAAEKGLVAHWAFDEARGAVVRDASGNRNHGQLRGPTFVKTPRGHGLQFDGVDDFVDCGSSRSLQQLELAGTIEFWFKPKAFQGGLINWSTGSGWPDERLVIAFLGPHQLIHAAANGLAPGKHYREYALHLPARGVWNHLVLTFDSATIAYYLDGRLLRVHSPAYARPEIAGVSMWIGRSQGLGKSYFSGLMDEVRIYNRALPSDEVLAHYKKAAEPFGKDLSVFETPRVRTDVLPEPAWVSVEADYGLMRPLPGDSRLEVRILDAGGKRTLARKADPSPGHDAGRHAQRRTPAAGRLPCSHEGNHRRRKTDRQAGRQAPLMAGAVRGLCWGQGPEQRRLGTAQR